MQTIQIGEAPHGLRQGDVLEFRAEPRGPYNCGVAVVLTADCDLVQEKHYGQILLCPVLPALEYFRKVWLPRRLEKVRARLLVKAGETYRTLLGATDARGISNEVLELVLASEVALDASLNSAGVPGGEKREALRRDVKALVGMRNPSACDLASYAAAEALRSSRSPEKVTAELIASFKEEIARDAIDVVVLPDHIYPDSLANVVMLRCPFSVPIESIHLDSARQSHLRRIGVFDGRIKFLIAQKFGFLFSRIGMPGIVEAERSECVSLLEGFN